MSRVLLLRLTLSLRPESYSPALLTLFRCSWHESTFISGYIQNRSSFSRGCYMFISTFFPNLEVFDISFKALKPKLH